MQRNAPGLSSNCRNLQQKATTVTKKLSGLVQTRESLSLEFRPSSSKKPDSVWQISKTLDALARIAVIKNPDGVSTIPQTPSGKFGNRPHARR